MRTPTLKQYLQHRQFHKKVQKQVSDCSKTQKFSSENEEKYVTKMIEIKAKLDMYLSNDRNKSTLESDLDELYCLFKKQIIKQWRDEINPNFLFDTASITFQKINKKSTLTPKNQLPQVPNFDRKFSFQCAEQNSNSSKPGIQVKQSDILQAINIKNSLFTQSANEKFFSMSTESFSIIEKEQQTKQQRNNGIITDKKVYKNKQNTQNERRKKIEYYRDQLKQIRKERKSKESFQKLKNLNTFTPISENLDESFEEKKQIGKTQSTNSHTDRKNT